MKPISTALGTAWAMAIVAAVAIVPGRDLQAGQTFSRWSTLCEGIDHTAGIALGDIDADGDLDVVFANGRHLAELNRVWSNDGFGGFYGKRPLGTEADPSYGVALGDVDGDGALDVIIANDVGDRAPVYRNDGTGNFTFLTFLSNSRAARRAVAVGDLDGDGDVDAVLVGLGQDHLYFNEGAGRRWTERPLGSENARGLAVVLADLDRDGDLDIGVANRYEGQSLIYVNDGRGTFAETRGLGRGPEDTTSIAVGDIDGDGDLDIVTANWEQPHAVYFNDGRGRFTQNMTFGGGQEQTWTAVLGDMDLDGDLDVLVGNVNVGYWDEDVDGDGRPDRWGFERRDVPSRVYVNDGRGRLTAGTAVSAGPDNTRPVAVGDLDGDGDLDIVAGHDCQPNQVLFNPLRSPTRKSGRAPAAGTGPFWLFSQRAADRGRESLGPQER